MRKLTYVAVFEPAADGGFGVYFPDVPGCTSFGDTFEEAQENAADALGLHIYGMEKDSEPLPEASKQPQIDPETAQGYFLCPVTIFPDMVANQLDNRRLKTTISLPAWLKEEAEAQGVNYSKILEMALLDVLNVKVR